MYSREGRVRKSDILPPFKALKIHHHVVLNPVCHSTTKEKGMTIDCRGVENQTWSALQYNLIIIFFEEWFDSFVKRIFKIYMSTNLTTFVNHVTIHFHFRVRNTHVESTHPQEQHHDILYINVNSIKIQLEMHILRIKIRRTSSVPLRNGQWQRSLEFILGLGNSIPGIVHPHPIRHTMWTNISPLRSYSYNCNGTCRCWAYS